MNERIQQLDKAAQEYAGRLVGNDEDSNYNEWFYVYKAKFAELIVKECAGVCEDYRGTEWGKAAECIGDSIKEHFGVEQ